MLNCKTATLRVLVYIFNTLIFLFGAVILGLGIWVLVDQGGLKDLMNDYMYAAVGILIGCGGLVMLTAFLGCFACSNDSKPGVVVYCIIMMVVIMLKVAACIVLQVYYNNTSTYLFDSYKANYTNDPAVKASWDSVQKLGKCCGVKQYLDWESSTYFTQTGQFPDSCCTLDSNSTAVNLVSCRAGNPSYLYTKGCDSMLQLYYYVISAVTVIVILFEIVATIWIICLYQTIP